MVQTNITKGSIALGPLYGYGRTWGNPDQFLDRTTTAHRQARYMLNWGYHDGTAFSALEEWARYKDDHNLPWSIRQVDNLIHKLNSFWYLHVYSGTLSEDGLPLPNGMQNAIPIDWGENEEALAPAIAQLNRWWGWVDQVRVAALWTTVLGECMVELNVDFDRRKVLAEIVWPGYIHDLRLDHSGNVKSYTKEYLAFDPDANGGIGEEYLYTRKVDTKKIRTFKNGEPHGYDGQPASVDNAYGFVPATWWRFWNVGGAHGEPALWGAQAAYDELMGLFSLWNDRLRLVADSPLIVTGNLTPGSVQDAMDEFYEFEQERPVDAQPIPITRWKLLQVQGDAAIRGVEMNLNQVKDSIEKIKEGILDVLPEVRFQEMLREMRQLTGPGAERAMLDVATRYRTVGAGMDRQVKKLYQMGVSMAAFHLKDGSWQESADRQDERMSRAQEVFAPFDLTSFDEGGLSFNILPRDLVPETDEERQAKAVTKDGLGVPRLIIYKEDLGYTEEDFAEWTRLGLVPTGFFAPPTVPPPGFGGEPTDTPLIPPTEGADTRLDELLAGGA